MKNLCFVSGLVGSRHSEERENNAFVFATVLAKMIPLGNATEKLSVSILKYK